MHARGYLRGVSEGFMIKFTLFIMIMTGFLVYVPLMAYSAGHMVSAFLILFVGLAVMCLLAETFSWGD